MLTALQQALDEAGRDESVRVVVLAAAGKAFCAGHNLKDMAAHPELAYYQKVCAVQPHDVDHPQAQRACHCAGAGHGDGCGVPAGGAV